MQSRILVVEDEPIARDSLKLLLELEGYTVATAGNGHEALASLAELGQPCLIVLDLMMPVMNGWEFLEAIRVGHARLLEDSPIIVVSAAADSLDYGLLRQYPVLKKPFAIESLLSKVRQHCEAR